MLHSCQKRGSPPYDKRYFYMLWGFYLVFWLRYAANRPRANLAKKHDLQGFTVLLKYSCASSIAKKRLNILQLSRHNKYILHDVPLSFFALFVVCNYHWLQILILTTDLYSCLIISAWSILKALLYFFTTYSKLCFP